MAHAYDALPDEEKVLVAIDFVAHQQPIPEPLRAFLKTEKLLTLIENPEVVTNE
jgi:hypothetical protein